MKEEDTLELVLKEQLIVLENWPKERKIIVAYEP
jgi:triosephosphate isomerase